MPFLDFLHAVADRRDLSAQEAEDAMTSVLNGDVSTPLLAAFLVALRMKGETGAEVWGFARAMRARVTPVDGGDPDSLIDTCGTGGDGGRTFNVSTVAAFVVAGAGVRVAKHGNRSLSSQCGSADILEALGVRIDLTPDQMGECIRETGIGFLFAPALHPAMKHAQPARAELKMRTAFNLLGPLTNPARAARQLIGAPSEHAAELMASALARLGTTRGFLVHGLDGLDEVTTTGPTKIWEIQDDREYVREVGPRDFGVDTAAPGDLRGGGRDENAAIAREILFGKRGPRRDIVLVNAAMALIAAGQAADYAEGVARASESIDSGAARRALDRMARFTNSFSSPA